MSSNCKSCGSHVSTGCGCSSNVYRKPSYQGHGHSPSNVNNYYYGEQPEYVHPGPCDTTPEECGPIWEVTGAARPLDYGTFKVRDACGDIKPYAWVLVTYTGTSTKAPLWSHPSKEDKYLLANPVQTNYNGEAQIYFAGGPVDITVFCDDNGQPGTEVISRITNYGGYVDADFRVDTLPIVECPKDIGKPLIKVNDGNKCNIPAAFMEPKNLAIMLNIANGEPAGCFDDVKDYFNCLGIDWPNGVKVYGCCTTNGCPDVYVYDGVNCDQECPPDPCDVVFDGNGESPCWKKCNTDVCEQVTEEPETDATHALDCDGGLVRRPLPAQINFPQLISGGPVLIEERIVTADFDTGVVTIDLNTLPGVTVPAGATGVIVKTHASTDGDEVLPSGYAEMGIILVEGTLPSGLNKLQLNTAVYIDANLGKADNDNDNQLMVDAPTLPNLRYQMKHDFGGATDSQAYYQIALVGFV